MDSTKSVEGRPGQLGHHPAQNGLTAELELGHQLPRHPLVPEGAARARVGELLAHAGGAAPGDQGLRARAPRTEGKSRRLSLIRLCPARLAQMGLEVTAAHAPRREQHREHRLGDRGAPPPSRQAPQTPRGEAASRMPADRLGRGARLRHLGRPSAGR